MWHIVLPGDGVYIRKYKKSNDGLNGATFEILIMHAKEQAASNSL